MADNQINYYSYEKFDFYVRRQVIVTNNVGRPRIIVNVDNDGDVSSRQINFDPNTNPTFQVRIPALMVFRSDSQTHEQRNIDLLTHIMFRYRPQIPSHVYIRAAERTINYTSTFWKVDPVVRKRLVPNEYFTEEQTRFYDADAFQHPIRAIYPCYRQVDGQPLEMVLGVSYMPVPEPQRRTYSYLAEAEQSEYAFDITQSFIDIDHQIDYHFTSLKLMPMSAAVEDRCTALYVCRGARLVVTDLRHSRSDTNDKCCSLYQMGSLVIVRGELQFAVNSEQYSPGLKAHTIQRTYYAQSLRQYFHPIETVNRVLSEVEINLDGLYRELNMRGLRRRVLFLGGADSKHNSVTWRLNIYPDDKNDKVNNATLHLLEGGYFVDVSSWRAGFRQIYWRHRYERLYEAVLNPITDNVLPFQVPDDFFFFKRILGLDISVNALSVQWPYAGEEGGEELQIPDHYRTHGHDGDDRDIRRYIPFDWEAHQDVLLRNIERPFNRPFWLELTGTAPAAPPLYPPYLTREAMHTQQKMCYLDRNDKVYAHDSVRDRHGNTIIRYRINDKEDLYTLAVTRDLKEGWLPYTEEMKELMPIHFDQSETSQWIRLGSDLQYYMKADWNQFPPDTERAHYVSYYLKPDAGSADSDWHLEDMDVDEGNEAVDEQGADGANQEGNGQVMDAE